MVTTILRWFENMPFCEKLKEFNKLTTRNNTRTKLNGKLGVTNGDSIRRHSATAQPWFNTSFHLIILFKLEFSQNKKLHIDNQYFVECNK